MNENINTEVNMSRNVPSSSVIMLNLNNKHFKYDDSSSKNINVMSQLYKTDCEK